MAVFNATLYIQVLNFASPLNLGLRLPKIESLFLGISDVVGTFIVRVERTYFVNNILIVLKLRYKAMFKFFIH